jgi:hypothetical protein
MEDPDFIAPQDNGAEVSPDELLGKAESIAPSIAASFHVIHLQAFLFEMHRERNVGLEKGSAGWL